MYYVVGPDQSNTGPVVTSPTTFRQLQQTGLRLCIIFEIHELVWFAVVPWDRERTKTGWGQTMTGWGQDNDRTMCKK